jgi:hypothetical protein
MSTEELKMILEVLTRTTDTASNAAIWWMVLHYGSNLLTILTVIGGLCIGVWLICRAAVTAGEWGQAARNVAKSWGGRGETYLYTADRDALNRAMRAGSERNTK